MCTELRISLQSQTTLLHFEIERVAKGCRQQVMCSCTQWQFFLASQFKLCICVHRTNMVTEHKYGDSCQGSEAQMLTVGRDAAAHESAC